MKTRISILLLILFCINSIGAQSLKEKKFQKAVYDVIKYYNNKDSVEFNKLIDKDIGIYVLAKPGAMFFAYHRKDFSFEYSSLPVPVPWFIETQKIYDKYKLKYADPGILDCFEDNLNEGLFIDLEREKHLLSETMKFLKKYEDPDYMTDAQIEKVVRMEKNSRRVLILRNSEDSSIEKSDDSFIFYLTYIKNKWYITIIDFATFDCSA